MTLGQIWMFYGRTCFLLQAKYKQKQIFYLVHPDQGHITTRHSSIGTLKWIGGSNGKLQQGHDEVLEHVRGEANLGCVKPEKIEVNHNCVNGIGGYVSLIPKNVKNHCYLFKIWRI